MDDATYSISNVGDEQILVRDVYMICDTDELGFPIVRTSCEKVPMVLKPGDIELFTIQYDKTDFKKKLLPGRECCVCFSILSTKGATHSLWHAVSKRTRTIYQSDETRHKVFSLRKSDPVAGWVKARKTRLARGGPDIASAE